jgi:CubicO group peptidase (beta-lactamase class C family)
MFKLRVAVAVFCLLCFSPAPVAADDAKPNQVKATRSCSLPGTGEWERASPSEVNVDPQKLQAALDFARPRMTQEIAVFRHGCLIDERRWFTGDDEKFEGWSLSKSVTAMAAGRAITLGLMDVDDPIGMYLPEADAEHASITVRDLLTMTSGLHWNLWRDYNIMMKDRVKDALSLPLDHEPGNFFEYAQSPVGLLAKVVGNAAGEDFQDFIQRELMEPIGMSRGDWSWLRDRAGNTEGYRGLNTSVDDFSRLGHLMLHQGSWNAAPVLDATWVADAIEPTATNPGYGYMFWLNEGDRYIAPTVYSRDERDHRLIESAPSDMYLMAGIQQQRVWVIPSLDMVVVRVGGSGDRDPDTRASVFTAAYGEFEHEFFRLLMPAVLDAEWEDPGPYQNGSPIPPLDPNYGIVKSTTEPEDMIEGFGGP